MKEKCLRCNHPTKGCIPYLMSLTTPELCDWLRMWKDRFGWSNADLAEKSNVPKGTVDRVLAHNDKGVKLFTVRPLICAVVGCTLEELEACEKDSVSVQALEEENQMLNNTLATIKKEHEKEIAFLKEQIRFKEAQMVSKDKLLDERAAFMRRKDRYITTLAISLAVVLLVIIAALVIDSMNPEVGFFWRTASFFENITNGTKEIVKWAL